MKRAAKADLEDAGLQPPELKTYQFRLQGHGQHLFVGTFDDTSEEGAFTQAFKHTKRFELPGWSLVCVTTKTALPVVRLTGYEEDPMAGPYPGKRGRKVVRRV